MTNSVTFETKCYERDWQFLLKAGRLQKMIDYCDYSFNQKVLYINNVNDLNLVKKYADKAVNKGTIDSYIVVDEYADLVLKTFNIEKESFKGGYYYSIQELTGIYLCKTDYLLHFSGDALMKIRKPWIDEAIVLIRTDKNILAASAFWEARKLNTSEHQNGKGNNDFLYSIGFSDQCYLIDPIRFRADIYNEPETVFDRFPAYGGELFEKRVNIYLRNHNLTRIVSKQAAYRHRNYPKHNWKRWLWINVGIKIE
jgi:hypothetical protein